MPAKVEEKLITAEELARMAIDGPCELVDGRIVPMSPAGMFHGVVAAYILRLLEEYVRARDLGLIVSSETGFRVKRDPDRVRAPDLAFVSNATLARGKAAGETFFPCAPDLAVEVLSPDDAWEKVEDKVRDYLSASGKLVWVVSPALQKVYIYAKDLQRRELGVQDEIDGGEAVPGFRARVAAFFGN